MILYVFYIYAFMHLADALEAWGTCKCIQSIHLFQFSYSLGFEPMTLVMQLLVFLKNLFTCTAESHLIRLSDRVSEERGPQTARTVLST